MKAFLVILGFVFGVALPFMAVAQDKMMAYQHQKTDEISSQAKDRIETIHQAILKGDRQTVADHACFPLNIAYPDPHTKPGPTNLLGGAHKTFSDKAGFLKYYDKVFTKTFIKQLSHYKWTPWWHTKGIMIQNGSIWMDYDGCLKAVNNYTNLKTN